MLDDLNITRGLTSEEICSSDFIYGNTLTFTNEWITGPSFRKAMIWLEKNKGKPDFQLGDQKDEWENSCLADMTVDDMRRLRTVANLLQIKSLFNIIKTSIYFPKKYLIVKTVDNEIFLAEPNYSEYVG